MLIGLSLVAPSFSSSLVAPQLGNERSLQMTMNVLCLLEKRWSAFREKDKDVDSPKASISQDMASHWKMPLSPRSRGAKHIRRGTCT